MSLIGRRTHYRDYASVTGLIIGRYGPDACLVRWDDPLMGTCRELTAYLVILPETETVDDGFLDGDPDPIR